MLWWLAQNTASAGLLACVVFAVCRVRRFSPAVRHVLWLLVLVKLLTPPLIAWPWPVPDIWPAEASALGSGPALDSEEAAAAVDPHDAALGLLEQAIADLSAEKSGLETLAAGGVPAEEEDAVPLLDLVPVAAAEPGKAASFALPAWVGPWALYSWLAGMGVMVLAQWRRIARFRRRLAQAQPGPRWLLRLIRHLGARLRVPLPRPVIVPGSGSPLLWSLGRPKLVWPADLLDRLPVESRRSVVAHELAHLKRRDHWVGWLLLVAECLWWWNPLFWWVRRQVRHNAELACDAWVVSTLPDDRRAYAEALIEVSQWVSTAALPVPALGMSQGPRQAFTERLTMIMRDATPCRVPRYGLLAVGLLALLVIPGWSLAQKAGDQRIEVKKAITVPPADGEEVLFLLSRIVADEEQQQGAGKGSFKVVVEAEDGQGADRAKKVQDVRDRKLEELEQKLQALLKEIQALRGAPATTATRIPVEVRSRSTNRVPQKSVEVDVPPAVPVQPAQVELKARVIQIPPKDVEVQVETLPGTVQRRYTATSEARTVTTHSPEVTTAIKKAIAALQAAGKKAEAEELIKAFESMHTPYRININTRAPSSAAPKTQGPAIAGTEVAVPPPGPSTRAVIRAAPAAPAVVVPPVPNTGAVQVQEEVMRAVGQARQAVSGQLHRYRATATQPGELLLSRATYKLENKAKAEALGAFLKDNLKASVMEIKVDGESLTITTTPEAQKAIGQLMGLTKGDGKTKTSNLGELKQLPYPLSDVRILYEEILDSYPNAVLKPQPTEKKEPKKP